MIESDKPEFARILKTTIRAMRGEVPDADVLRLWWQSLARYDLQAVSAALSQYSMRGKFSPVPADIIEILEKAFHDGRPGAEEAWAMIPRDEFASVVMTEEMAEAYGLALPLLNEGDPIAARMTFKESYNRIVERNKMTGIPPKWFPSLGQDKEGRKVVLENAVRLGRIGAEHAAKLLPPAQAVESNLLQIESKVSPEKAKENLLRIKSMIENFKSKEK